MNMTTARQWTLYDEATGVKVLVQAIETDLGLKFQIDLLEGIADLNGFFIDLAGDGGAVTTAGSGKGNNAINMNGADSNGYKIAGFDDAWAIGEAGIGKGKTDVSSATVIYAGKSMADIGAETIVGLRATSVGVYDETTGTIARNGSLKLTATTDPVNEPEIPADHFPVWQQDISHTVFYFNTTDGDRNGDGYYTVKIDSIPGSGAEGFLSNDPDDWYGDVVSWLVTNDPNVNADTELLGIAIKGGIQQTQYFALDGDPAADPLPDGLTDLVENRAIDSTYDWML
jgi:hypothetical protein